MRGVNRKNTLDTHTMRNTPYSESFSGCTTILGNHHTGKHLYTFLVTFLDLNVHFDIVTDRKNCLLVNVLFIYLIYNFRSHNAPIQSYLFNKSGLFLMVLATACSFRHRAISSWLPDINISGTFIPLYSGGLVY